MEGKRDKIMATIKRDNRKKVERLIKAGVDVNATVGYGSGES